MGSRVRVPSAPQKQSSEIFEFQSFAFLIKRRRVLECSLLFVETERIASGGMVAYEGRDKCNRFRFGFESSLSVLSEVTG